MGEKEVEQVYFIATGLSPLLHVKDLIVNKKKDLYLDSTTTVTGQKFVAPTHERVFFISGGSCWLVLGHVYA